MLGGDAQHRPSKSPPVSLGVAPAPAAGLVVPIEKSVGLAKPGSCPMTLPDSATGRLGVEPDGLSRSYQRLFSNVNVAGSVPAPTFTSVRKLAPVTTMLFAKRPPCDSRNV